VAEEACVTAEVMGNTVERLFDVGVAGIHRLLGEHARLAAARVLRLDPVNPQIASLIVGAFGSWRRFAGPRRALQQGALQRIARAKRISRDVAEIVERCLAANS